MISTLEWEERILDCLSNTTYNDPMPVRDIAEIIGMEESHPSCPRTRKLILKTMQDFVSQKKAIGSDGRGYYMINNEHEMQRYLNSLLNRQIAITKRIEITYNAFYGIVE